MGKTKIPEDIIEGLKALSEAKDVPLKSLLERMKEIKETDENIQAIGEGDKANEFKIRVAWAILYDEMSSAGQDFIVKPLLTPQPREVKIKGEPTWVGDLTAIVCKLKKGEDGKLQKGDPQYASGTFWRDGAKALTKVSKDKVYRATLGFDENKWGLSISSNGTTFTPVDEKIDFDKFYEEEIKPMNNMISLCEIDLNKSEDSTDIRVIRATVSDAQVGERDGRAYGWYDIMDNTISGSKFRLFMHPDDICFMKGSVIDFGGNIDKGKDDEARFNPQFLKPTERSMKATYEITPVTKTVEEKETVDVSEPVDTEESKEDETTEVKEETKEESKEEPKKEKKKEESSEEPNDFEI